ncbi:MAG: hypothetical protein M1497_00775 [Nitrospirae bacterium]|nr:hypothetical protein [Nitrospirota bacterium]MCL5021903.1 hypothetical protein [Nitrospirota bacterium]
MIETDLSSITIEEMQEGENKDKIFRLIWVQNLDMSDHRFRVLFKLAEPDGKYLMAKIAPEQLFVYAPGAYYINGQRLENPQEEGENIPLSFDALEKNSVRTVGKAFSDDLYDLRHHRLTYSKSQYCVVIDTGTHEFIFPCFVLGAAYYFTSASMCRQLFAQALEGLYEPGSIHVDPGARHASIFLKTNAADGDAADIIRFAKNSNARKKWEGIVHNLRRQIHKGKEDMNVPLIADFPVAAKLTVTVRAVRRFYPELGKEKVLILEILKENSPFDFDKLTIERINMPPRKVDVTRRTKERMTTRVTTVRVPTSGLASADIKNTEPPKNIHKSEMVIEKKYVGDEKGSVLVPTAGSGEGEADLSLTDSANDGDAGVRHGEVKPPDQQDPEIRYKECFSLKDFQEMVVPLAKEEGVQDFQIIGPLAMPRRTGKNIKGSRWEFFDREHTTSRKYLRVTFTYKSISACLVEVDQNALSSTTATYVLMLPDRRRISHDEVREFLDMFVKREMVELMGDHFRSKGFIFFGKKHPIDKTGEHYQAWRHALLRRIGGLAQEKEEGTSVH